MDHHRTTEHRSRRRALLSGALPLLLAAGVAGVSACSSDSSDGSGGGKSFRAQYTDECESLTGGDNAAQLGRLVPDAGRFKTSESGGPGKGAGGKRGFSARCSVAADGKRAVTLAVEPARGQEDWQADVVAGVDWGRGQERLDGPAAPSGKEAPAKSGYVSRSAAALYVPCPARGGALSVTVTTPPGGGAENSRDSRESQASRGSQESRESRNSPNSDRKALATLAERTAVHAMKRAGC